MNILQWKDEEDEKFTPGGRTEGRKRKESRISAAIGPYRARALALYIQPSSSAYRDFRLDHRRPSKAAATLCVRVYSPRVDVYVIQ